MGMSKHNQGLYDALLAERDRLVRVLAVERGDESAAPPEWESEGSEGKEIWHRYHRQYRDFWVVQRVRAGVYVVFPPAYPGVVTSRHMLYKTALDAMEAADAMREQSDPDKSPIPAVAAAREAAGQPYVPTGRIGALGRMKEGTLDLKTLTREGAELGREFDKRTRGMVVRPGEES